LDVAEDGLNRSVSPRKAADDFIRIVQAETNDVAILQNAAISFFAVHENAAAVSPILQIPAAALGNNRGTLTRDPAVYKLKMIPSFAAPNAEGRFGEANKPGRAVRGYNFQSSFVDGW
jgi:hypothetical protein